MKQREAFEAWADPIFADMPNWRESGAGELARQAWQAATDRASDVAVKVCNGEMVEEVEPVDHCYNNACVRCADAIKEALK